MYAPGSTFKLITALYVLEHLNFNPNTKYFCSGFTEFGDRKFHCWKEEGHGLIDLKGQLKNLVIAIFIILLKLIKIDSLSEFSKNFSLGVSTRIDIPNELIGIMPNRKWKKKIKAKDGKKVKLLSQ